MGAFCTCGNADHKKAKHYDGCLGYEALVCTICGRYQDHLSDKPHDADEWSIGFLGAKALLLQNWHKSGKPAYAQGSSVNYDQDKLLIKADSEADALKFFADNNGFGKSGERPPYSVRKEWQDGILTCLATYCGYD